MQKLHCNDTQLYQLPVILLTSPQFGFLHSSTIRISYSTPTTHRSEVQLPSFTSVLPVISKNVGISLVVLVDPLHGPLSGECSSDKICRITPFSISTNPSCIKLPTLFFSTVTVLCIHTCMLFLSRCFANLQRSKKQGELQKLHLYI
jgi:hypothetical protein